MIANYPKALQVAQAEVGKRVQEIQSNWGGRITEYLHAAGIDSAAAWCAAFNVYCFDQAGGCPWENNGAPAYVPAIHNWASKLGLFRAGGIYTPKGGDLVLFGASEHIEMVERTDAYLHTIGGNTYDDAEQDYPHAPGLQGLWRKKYERSNPRIMGFVAWPLLPAPRNGLTILVDGKVITTGDLKGNRAWGPMVPVLDALGVTYAWSGERRELLITSRK